MRYKIIALTVLLLNVTQQCLARSSVTGFYPPIRNPNGALYEGKNDDGEHVPKETIGSPKQSYQRMPSLITSKGVDISKLEGAIFVKSSNAPLIPKLVRNDFDAEGSLAVDPTSVYLSMRESGVGVVSE